MIVLVESPPFKTEKPLAGYDKWSPLNFSMVLVSVDFVRNSLDDSVIGEAVIPVIEHRNDQMFMDDNAHDFACVNDSLCDCDIVL